MKLTEIIKTCKQSTNKQSFNFPEKIKSNLNYIAEIIPHQKGLFSVIITSAIYKSFYPNQDIRIHKTELDGGYSGRSFDTKYITPTLKKEGLTHMAESGWLTRSIEQPHPFTEDFPGKIRNGKKQFLEIMNFIEYNPSEIDNVLKFLITENLKYIEKNTVKMVPLEKRDGISIIFFKSIIQEFLYKDYKTSGGSKIPVILMHSLMSLALKQFKKYKDCKLNPLGSHTASDRTSKTSGDLEIFKKQKNFESFEIKHNVKINEHLMLIAKEKIIKFNPLRFYFFTTDKDIIETEEKKKVFTIVNEIRLQHGCQIILDNFISIFIIYAGMLESLSELIDKISKDIFSDNELKLIHKNCWKQNVDKINDK